MLRTTLLAALAAATLAGCATTYGYRGGASGDYYYGQPRTEYRYYSDPYGYYGSSGYGVGSYSPGRYGYYYDRFGRVVYGYPNAYYGYPSGYGSQWWYRPRPHGHGGGEHHGDHDADRDDRRPPWRNLGGVVPRGEQVAPGGHDQGPRARGQQMPSALPMPQRDQPSFAPAPQRMRSEDGGGGSRMGRAIRNAKTSPPPEE